MGRFQCYSGARWCHIELSPEVEAWPLQVGVQALVLSVCSRRTAAALHAWRQQCQDKAKQRQAEGQRLQAAVRRLAHAKQATMFVAWHVHARARAAQRQLCMRAIRQASTTFLDLCMHAVSKLLLVLSTIPVRVQQSAKPSNSVLD